MSSVSPERCETIAVQPARRAELDRLDRLGQCPDLVELDQDAVRGLLVDRPLDPLGVRDEQVVADELDPVAEPAA